MAGIPFQLRATITPIVRPSSASPLLSSSDSKLFGLPFSNPNSFKFHTSLAITTYATAARYGGGGGGGGGGARRSSNFGGDRRGRNEAEEDQALDMSTIKSNTVRLIDENQNMVGVVSSSQALQMAGDAELDLVIVSPDADPPVVKIMDYNKYRYELQKKKRDQQKKSAASRMDLKELKMGFNIDEHDYSVRLRAARKFLTDGDKIKIIVSLKGRENEFRNIAIELIRRFQNDLGELATEEAKNFRADKCVLMILVPNKAALAKTQDPPMKKDKSAADEVSVSIEA